MILKHSLHPLYDPNAAVAGSSEQLVQGGGWDKLGCCVNDTSEEEACGSNNMSEDSSKRKRLFVSQKSSERLQHFHQRTLYSGMQDSPFLQEGVRHFGVNRIFT